MKKLAVIFCVWMLVVNIFALFALNRFNLAGDTAYNWVDDSVFFQTHSWNIADLHARWDSPWYLDIAQNGYVFNGPEAASNLAFFPVYPMLMRGLSSLFLDNYIVTGWALSGIFLFLSLVYFYKLVKEFHKKINPYLPILLLLIFPTAFFLNAVYTESLFLFLSLAAFYYTLKKNYLLAGIFGFFAALTRVTGVLLFIPLIWEYLFGQKKGKRSIKPDMIPLALVPFGTFLYFFWHYVKYGDFFLWLKIEAWWGRAFELNTGHFDLFSNPAIVNFIFDCGFVATALILMIFVYKKLRPSYAIYMFLTLAVALGSGTMMSIGRYILVLFPMYILIAGIKNDVVRQTWIFASLLLFAMNIILFVNNYWAG